MGGSRDQGEIKIINKPKNTKNEYLITDESKPSPNFNIIDQVSPDFGINMNHTYNSTDPDPFTPQQFLNLDLQTRKEMQSEETMKHVHTGESDHQYMDLTQLIEQ